MARKKDVKGKTVSQGDVARLFMSGIDIFSTELLVKLSEEHDDLGLDKEGLKKVQTLMKGVKASVTDSTLNQLVKLY